MGLESFNLGNKKLMKVFSRMDLLMVKENTTFLNKISMKDNGFMEKEVGKVQLLGLTQKIQTIANILEVFFKEIL
jgi:hypothetical protein